MSVITDTLDNIPKVVLDCDMLKFRISADIHRIMTNKGISEAELAKMVGISERSLKNFFIAEKNFDMNYLAKIISALDVQIKLDSFC